MFTWLLGSPGKPPVLLRQRSSRTFIIITVSTAIFTDIFLYGIVVPVLPFALTTRAAVKPSTVQTWVAILLAVYGAAMLVAAPLCGWLTDRSGSRRGSLLLGLAALAGSTAMLCVGNGIPVLAAARVLQGFSAAVVWVVGLALLVDTVGTDGVGQAMGYVGLSMSLALLVAPLLGGIVFAHAGYFAVFAMAFGLIVLDVFLRLALIEKRVAAQWLQDEEAGEEGGQKVARAADEMSPTTTIEMDPFPVDEIRQTLTESPAEPPAEGAAAERTNSAASPAASFVQALPANTPGVFKRFASRLPPVIFLLSSRRILCALFVSVIQASLMTSFDSTLPLFVRNTFHWNSTGAGLIFLPLLVTSFLGPVVGWLSDKHGSRWYATAGFVLACPCLVLLRLVHEDTLGQKVLLCALLALVGVTLTLIITPVMAEITYAVDEKTRRHPPGYFGKNGAYAQAYSLYTMAWSAGCFVGPLLAGLVNQANGWGTATLILGCISIVTAVPTAIWTGGSWFKIRRRRREQRTTEAGIESPA